MNLDQITASEAQVRTLVQLLLSNKPMAPGLVFLAGDEIDTEGREKLARTATAAEIDIVYVAFRVDDAGAPVIADIVVFLPRDRVCYSWNGCVPTLAAGHRRAALVSPFCRGYFTILPCEIVQHAKRPAWIEAGVERAARRMNALLDNQADVADQASVDRLETARPLNRVVLAMPYLD